MTTRTLFTVSIAITLSACASLGSGLQETETWAKRVCRIVEVMPMASASASTLRTGDVVHVTITPTAVAASLTHDAGPGDAP